MNELVSVVIPVYNVEKYVARCIESVINQSYCNIEILIINDGSMDNSENICRIYQKQDDRIIYIYQENQGLAGARNTGIRHAHGTYIVFVDSDDYVATDYVKILYDLLKKYNADMSICGHKKTLKDNEIIEKKIYPVYQYSGVELVRRMYEHNLLEINVAWNKMYRKDMFNNEQFPLGKLHEDFVLNTKLMYYSKKIVYTYEPLYFYYQSPNSITRRVITKRNLDCLEQIEKRMDFYREVNEESLYNRTVLDLEVLTLKYYYLCKREVPNSHLECKLIMQKYRKYLTEALSYKEISFAKKVYISLGGLFPRVMGMVTHKMFKIE